MKYELYVYIMKQKNYTGIALLIPFSIALAASVLPLRDAKLNSDIVQPAAPVGHTCEYDLCPSKGHNHYVPCSDGRECNTIDSLHFVYPVLLTDKTIIK